MCSRPCVFLASLKWFCRTGELLTLASEDRQHGSVLGTARGVSIPRVLVTVVWVGKRSRDLFDIFVNLDILTFWGLCFLVISILLKRI